MTAPVVEDASQDMPLERVAPVTREVPRLRGPRRPPRIAAVVAVLAALVAGLIAATAGDPPLRWSLVQGTLEAADDELSPEADVPVDAELVAGPEGVVLRAQGARLDVAPGTRFELLGSVGPVAQTVVLREGSVLADVEVTLSIDATVVTATGFGGAFRVDRDGTPRIATYSAAVGITGDTAVTLTRLHQVPLGGPQDAVGPIILDPDDPWDARHGEGALETDRQLADLATGLRATYGAGPQTAAFYRDFVGVTAGLVEALPQLAPVDRGRTFGPPAETLIAAAAVSALVEGTGRPLPDLLAEVVVDRAAGGTWGVILAQDDLDAAYLRGVTDEALRRRAGQSTPEPVLPEPGPADGQDEAEAEPDPAPTSAPSPDPTTEPTQEPSPEPDRGGPSEDPEPSEPGPLDDPVDTIDDLLDPEDLALDLGPEVVPPGRGNDDGGLLPATSAGRKSPRTSATSGCRPTCVGVR